MTSSNQRDPAIQLLLDKQEIHETLMRYCRGLDRCDEELMKSAYHPDAHDEHGAFRGNAWEFCERAVRGLRANYQATMHNIGNELIEVQGDVAHCESYVVAYHRFEREGKEHHWVFGGRYIDRFERRNGEWKIAVRITLYEWSRIDPVVEPYASVHEWTSGRRFPDDLVYQR